MIFKYPKIKIKPFKSKLVTGATNFYLNKLLPYYLQKGLKIYINFLGIIPKEYDALVNVKIKRRKATKIFSIDIKHQLSLKRLLIALAHEIVHIKQFINKEHWHRIIEENGKKVWRDFWFGIDYTDTEYKNRPWEIEARSLGNALFKSFIKKHPELEPICKIE